MNNANTTTTFPGLSPLDKLRSAVRADCQPLHKKGYIMVGQLNFKDQGKGRGLQPGIKTLRSVVKDVWEIISFVARVLPQNGGKEAMLLTSCWKVLEVYVHLYI
jgi:hypothetical protein